MKKIITIALALVLGCTFAASCTSSAENAPKKAKYVFYFIGDGMGFSHLSISEAYQQYKQDGTIGSLPLSFTRFPVLGMSTTYSASNMITCSSAAGTAMSTGTKTNNGYLGVDPQKNNLESISYKIHRAGKKVGIMTTVTIDHATPAAFYANSSARSDYYPIAKQLGETGFEFFGGGGFIKPEGDDGKQPSAYDYVEGKGYTIACGVEDFNQKKGEAKKMLMLQKEGKKSADLPYAIDRKPGDLTLAQLVKAGIEFLDNEDGFFIMAEGGKIDWASHSNDAKTAIMETIDLSEAVAEAVKFYEQHPDETLIIVTADHETGGFALGREKGYVVLFKELEAQTGTNKVNAETYEHADPKATIDKLNEAARLGWTTRSHTGTAVPVFAIGAGSENFMGKMDNTDIPRKICQSMGVTF